MIKVVAPRTGCIRLKYAQPAPEYNPNQNMNYQNPNAQPVAPQQAPVQPQAPAQQTSTVNMPQPPMQNDQNPNQ